MKARDANTATAALAARLWPYVAALLRARRTPLRVGISGLQGSGKSTLATALLRVARQHGVGAVRLALDDAYLGRAARRRMARTRHPLWLTRGAPGTHDVALLRATLRALRHASVAQPACLPRFDKGRDTRRPPSRWPRVTAVPALIVLEGWCLGVQPQSAAQLLHPLNALERHEDRDGRWRRAVNAALAAYAPLWDALDLRILLHAPGFAVASRWRAQAEAALRTRAAPRAMGSAQLRRFMQHYQRLSEHALVTLPRWADVRVDLDAAHGAGALRVARQPRARPARRPKNSQPLRAPARPPRRCRRPAPR